VYTLPVRSRYESHTCTRYAHVIKRNLSPVWGFGERAKSTYDPTYRYGGKVLLGVLERPMHPLVSTTTTTTIYKPAVSLTSNLQYIIMMSCYHHLLPCL